MDTAAAAAADADVAASEQRVITTRYQLDTENDAVVGGDRGSW